MKKLMFAAALAAVGTAFAVESEVVGYFSKSQPAIDAKTGLAYPTGIISFQWDKVDGTARKLNDVLKCSWGGQAWESEDAPEATQGWENGAPMIQIRESTGSYTPRYFAKDAYDLDSGEMYPAWCSTDGFVDKEVGVAVGGGFWLSTPIDDAQGKKTIYLKVANPLAK